MGYRKNLSNPYLYRQLSNSPTEMFNYTMTNLMDSFYDSALDETSGGTFKAVVLSAIRTEDNTGTGTDKNDAVVVNGFLNVVVRPLTPFGDILPDPLIAEDVFDLNSIISLHKPTFSARSDFEFKDTDPPKFGQILNCYFEDGSVENSNFRGLRFSKPTGEHFHPDYKKLTTFQGFDSLAGKDWTGASLLGEDADSSPESATAQGKTSNIKGDRTKPIEYIVIHYSAANGSKEAVLKYENSKTQYGYHYMIDKDGSHFETAPPDKIVWHAGGNGTVGNSNSVGICIMNVGFEREGVPAKSDWVTGDFPNANKEGKWEPYSQASLSTAAQICAKVLSDNGLTVDRIVGHSDIQSNKSDPGPAFGMDSFRRSVKAKMSV